MLLMIVFLIQRKALCTFMFYYLVVERCYQNKLTLPIPAKKYDSKV